MEQQRVDLGRSLKYARKVGLGIKMSMHVGRRKRLPHPTVQQGRQGTLSENVETQGRAQRAIIVP
jgi:hypothetical protein